LSIDARGVIDQKDNVDGFASTVTVWTRDWSSQAILWIL
jgi:hypothetical protein